MSVEVKKKYTNNFDLKDLKVLHFLINAGTSVQIFGPTYRMDCWLNDILHAIGIILLLFLEPIEYFFIKKILEKVEGSSATSAKLSGGGGGACPQTP